MAEFHYIAHGDSKFKWHPEGYLYLQMHVVERSQVTPTDGWIMIGRVYSLPEQHTCSAMSSAYYAGLGEGQRQGRLSYRDDLKRFLGIEVSAG